MNLLASVRERPLEFWTRTYWLEHCEGYRVETPQGRLGFVEEIIRDPVSEEPTRLLVRRCRGGSGLTAVPIARVSDVRPEAEEILLFDPATNEADDE